MKSTPLNNLQVLRGISALLVCCYHLRAILKESVDGNFLFGYGDIGVSIFFVISGFIISHSTKGEITHPRIYLGDYFIKRLIRVVPLYYFFTFIWLLVHGQLFQFLSAGGNGLLRVLFFIPFPQEPPPLYVGWTLNYEIYFYLVFGISFFFKEKRQTFVFIYFAVSLILLPFLFYLAGIDGIRSKIYPGIFYNGLPYLSLMTSPFLLLFLVGVLISRYYDKMRFDKKTTLGIFFASAVYFLFVYFSQLRSFVLEFTSCSLLVFSTLLLDKVFTSFTPKRFFTYLGDISYSLYLVHPIVISIYAPNLFKKIGLDVLNAPTVKFLVLLLASIVVGIISYELLEKRILFRLKDNLLKKRKRARQV